MLPRDFSNLIGDGAFLLTKDKYNVTVVGGGNAAHVLAGYAGSIPNVEVSMLNSLPHEKKIFQDNICRNMKVMHRNGQADIIGLFILNYILVLA
jgi:hypothetical protein